jgi:hypothetical protein
MNGTLPNLGTNLRRRTILHLLGLALVAAALFPSPAHAAPARKQYLVTVAPDAVGAGQTREYSFTATNQSGSQSLGSIDVTAPPDFTLMSVTQQPQRASDGSFVGTASLSGSTLLEIRNLSLPPSDSVTVRFTAQAPCTQDPGADEWGLAAKQSNDFKGTGNDFSPDPSSQRTTGVTGTCRLGWTTQPSDAKVGQAITNTPYDAFDGAVDGPAIAAEVLSAPYADLSRSRVTFSEAEVGLAIGDDPNQPDATATLSGTTSATAASGLAAFDPGPEIDLHGLNYTLLASNPDMDSGESAPFDVSDAVGDCSKSHCKDLSTNGNSVNAKLSSTSTTGIIAMSIGVLPELLCTGYTPNPEQQAVTILPLGVSSTSTMTVQITILASVVDRPASQYRICWASTETFQERDGTQSDPATISGDAMFKGLLPDCAKKNPVAPCQITPSKQDKQGNVILQARAPGDDPHAR